MAAKKSRLVQVEFGYINNRKLVWVDSSWNLKPGHKVEFEGGCLIWEVIKVYDTLIETDQIYTKWGLGLPKTFRTEK